MTKNVFTYGSLMFEPVWHRVVQGRYCSAPARLAGYGRFALLDDTYPGMVAAPVTGQGNHTEPGTRSGVGTDPAAGNQAVDGVVYFDVTPDDLSALDRFEGEEYQRRTVEIAIVDAAGASTAAMAASVIAQTYVFLALHRLSDRPWEPEKFALEHFLGSYCRDYPASGGQRIDALPDA